MTDVIAINCRVLGKSNLTGVGRYTLELVDSLVARADKDDNFYLIFGIEELPERLENRDCIESAHEPAWAHSGVKAHLWEQIRLPRALIQHDVDLLHTPAGQAPSVARLAQVTTIHDLSPLVHPEWFSRGYVTLFKLLTPLSVRTSDHVITVSRFSADEILDQYGLEQSKVSAVPNGVRGLPEGKCPDGVDIPDRYFLYVGSRNPRKNLTGLTDAYREYRDRVDDPTEMLLVGPDNDIYSDVDIAPAGGLQVTGYVSDPELEWLYRNAIAFVYPSLFEGFGLPILEAMNAGTPVITSGRGAMAEVAGDAAILVDPGSPDELATAMTHVEDDPEIREELSMAGRRRAGEFSWKRTAVETVNVYEKVLKS
jgi:glycosyltransferase involved in cell wall biosynthesis